MRFDWAEFLNLARYLQGDSTVAFSQEAGLRTAVSRAYYAAFGHAVEFARVKLRYRPTYDWQDHRNVRQHFVNSGKVDIAQGLEEMRQWRNDCDYRSDADPMISIRVESAINRADRILGALR